MRSFQLIAISLGALAAIAAPIALFPTLQSTVILGKQPQGFYLLPTSQLLQPWGQSIAIKGRPVDAALDSSARVIAILNSGSIDLFDRSTGTPIAHVPVHMSSYTGIAFRPGDKELWVSETRRTGNDAILVIDTSNFQAPKQAATIELEGHAVPCGIAFTKDGATAFVALSRRNSVGVYDAAARTLKKEIDAGIAPFAVAVSPQAGRAFVSNRGGRRPVPGDTTAPTSGSQAITDPVTGTTTTGTLTVIDLETFATRELPTDLAPSGLSLSPDEATLAVANGHSDTVSLFNTRTLARVDVAVPQFPEGSIGSQPIGVAWSASTAHPRLYVACAGINAIVALAPRDEPKNNQWQVAGAIPTGWFPSAILMGPDQSLHIVTIKGTGNTKGADGTFNSRQFEGSLVTVPAPDAAQLTAGLREVKLANEPQTAPSGGVENLTALGIKHVFFFVKENRTYDQVLGDVSKGNGDPKLVMFGRDVTPNHHALAENFVLLDNFFEDGAISFDGHQWLMQSFVSDYTERAFAASPRGYAWNMADALTVSPSGFFWQNRNVRPPSIRVYGEFCEPATYDPATQAIVDINDEDQLSWAEYWKMYKDGSWRNKIRERSGIPAVAQYLEPDYPFNSTVVPDQMRADSYLGHLAEMEKTGKLPQINVITLVADHTNGTRATSATPRAMVADDDYALGRIVEGISHSRFWKDSLIFVVEDDAQNGRDHVDGHRTVALAIGPHIRRNAVDSNFYTQSSMVRTIQALFRIAPQTRFVAAARPMNSIFTAKPDTAPYQALLPAIPFDEMNPPAKALAGEARWAERRSMAMDFSKPDLAPASELNRILDIAARTAARATNLSATARGNSSRP